MNYCRTNYSGILIKAIVVQIPIFFCIAFFTVQYRIIVYLLVINKQVKLNEYERLKLSITVHRKVGLNVKYTILLNFDNYLHQTSIEPRSFTQIFYFYGTTST